jgi:hypothetical protein
VIELRMNPEQITTRTTIAEMRAAKALKHVAKPKRAAALKHPKAARSAQPGKKRGG